MHTSVGKLRRTVPTDPRYFSPSAKPFGRELFGRTEAEDREKTKKRSPWVSPVSYDFTPVMRIPGILVDVLTKGER